MRGARSGEGPSFTVQGLREQVRGHFGDRVAAPDAAGAGVSRVSYASCVGSGFCCKVAPCGFGEVTSPSDPACKHLEVDRHVRDVPIYRCGRYEFIKTQPGWELSPAFGAGCSSTVFNEDRDRVVRVLRVINVP
jgi:hypothetical protein